MTPSEERLREIVAHVQALRYEIEGMKREYYSMQVLVSELRAVIDAHLLSGDYTQLGMDAQDAWRGYEARTSRAQMSTHPDGVGA